MPRYGYYGGRRQNYIVASKLIILFPINSIIQNNSISRITYAAREGVSNTVQGAKLTIIGPRTVQRTLMAIQGNITFTNLVDFRGNNNGIATLNVVYALVIDSPGDVPFSSTLILAPIGIQRISENTTPILAYGISTVNAILPSFQFSFQPKTKRILKENETLVLIAGIVSEQPVAVQVCSSIRAFIKTSSR